MAEPVVMPNSSVNVQLVRIGAEQTPVIIIDNFLAGIRGATDYARHAVRFGADGRSAYPGIRAPLPQSYVDVTLATLTNVFRRVYAIPGHLELHCHRSCFSLIAVAEQELMATQRVPHYDSNRPFYFAVTHYLNDGAFGGTGFFRHRATAFENVSETRLDRYRRAAALEVASTGGPAQRYITASTDQYELYGSVRYRANRLLAYPGSLLHSGLIIPETDINPDPATGRLTANLFIEFQ